jgi:hypothetical protein
MVSSLTLSRFSPEWENNHQVMLIQRIDDAVLMRNRVTAHVFLFILIS